MAIVNPYDVRSKRYRDLNAALENKGGEGGTESDSFDLIRFTEGVFVQGAEADVIYEVSLVPGATHFSYNNPSGDTVWIEYGPGFSLDIPGGATIQGKLPDPSFPIKFRPTVEAVGVYVEFSYVLRND